MGNHNSKKARQLFSSEMLAVFFKIVYSDYHSKPLIQFNIDTNLTKAQLLKLLLDPYGVSFEGFENYFRTVFTNSDWKGVILRFDLSFRSQKKKDFGFWMIKQGGRIIG